MRSVGESLNSCFKVIKYVVGNGPHQNILLAILITPDGVFSVPNFQALFKLRDKSIGTVLLLPLLYSNGNVIWPRRDCFMQCLIQFLRLVLIDLATVHVNLAVISRAIADPAF